MGIIKEYFKKAKENMGSGFNVNFKEESKYKIHGEVFLKLHDSDGNIIEEHKKNVIVDDASILIARLIKDNTEPLHGAYCLAVGTGNVGWDPMNPPAASNTQTALEAELVRKQFSSTNFVTGSGTISATPTNIVDFTTTFTESEAVGALVEMGLIGGDATLTPSSGTLMNYLTFKVINKSNTSVLTITWRLTF